MLWVFELRSIILNRISLASFQVQRFTLLVNLFGCTKEHVKQFAYLKAILEAEDTLYPDTYESRYYLGASSSEAKNVFALVKNVLTETEGVFILQGDWSHGPSR